ncbi:unnamed protein product [Discosporangium mesarthrocarpum]
MELATVNLMIKEVIPVIKARMPRPLGHRIFVQQDGAKSHTKKVVMEAIQDSAGDIIMETHPVNSPELFFFFFHSIQQLKEDVGVTDGEELVGATMEAFDVYPLETLERVWQSLFAVYGEFIGCKGGTSYKMPHLGKEKVAGA